MTDLDPTGPINRLHIANLQTAVAYGPTDILRIRARNTNRLSLIQRLAYYILKRAAIVECEPLQTSVFEYTAQKQKTVNDKLSAAICRLLDKGDSPEKYAIVVGADFFDELVYDWGSRDHIRLSLPEYRFTGLSGYRASYQNIPVHVVPYLSGIAIIPRIIVEMGQG